MTELKGFVVLWLLILQLVVSLPVQPLRDMEWATLLRAHYFEHFLTTQEGCDFIFGPWGLRTRVYTGKVLPPVESVHAMPSSDTSQPEWGTFYCLDTRDDLPEQYELLEIMMGENYYIPIVSRQIRLLGPYHMKCPDGFTFKIYQALPLWHDAESSHAKTTRGICIDAVLDVHIRNTRPMQQKHNFITRDTMLGSLDEFQRIGAWMKRTRLITPDMANLEIFRTFFLNIQPWAMYMVDLYS